jgi:PPP family 3-phenylpropionic acid transporter
MMPYWRLSGFYFFYFATIGALIPYWGLYLKSINFSASEIGQLIALMLLSRIVAPNIWGWISDARGQYMGVLRLAASLSVIAFCGVFLGTTFWWLAIVMFVFAFFWDACLPQLEAVTLSHLAGHSRAYARVRLWGSVGFIVSVMGLGYLFDAVALWWLLPSLLSLLLAILVMAMIVPEWETQTVRSSTLPFHKVFLQPHVGALLVACFLMQASHGPYYTFYSIYLEEYHYSKSLIGMLWAFGVLCEIGIFVIMHRVQMRYGARRVLLVSSGVAAVRWLLIGFFPDHLEILILAQALHAITFGAYHAAAISLIYKFFARPHQVRGQAIYGSVSFGLGGVLGSFYSGIAWSRFGPSGTFEMASILALAAFAVVYFAVRPNS